MIYSKPVFYRPSQSALICPFVLRPVPLVTALESLDEVARKLLWRVQQRASLPHQRDPQWNADYHPEAGWDWQQHRGLSYPPSKAMRVAHRDYQRRELSAVIEFGQAVDQAYLTRGVTKRKTPGELCAEYVDGLLPNDPQFMLHCMLVEVQVISNIVEGRERAVATAKQVVVLAQKDQAKHPDIALKAVA